LFLRDQNHLHHCFNNVDVVAGKGRQLQSVKIQCQKAKGLLLRHNQPDWSNPVT